MKIDVESTDLLTIADWILSNCDGLDNCDEDDIDDLVPYHASNIRQLAEDLQAITQVKEKRTTPRKSAFRVFIQNMRNRRKENSHHGNTKNRACGRPDC